MLRDHPDFGFVVPEQLRRVRAPVRVRLDHRGQFHLLGDAGGVLHLDAAGALAGRTPLTSREDRVIDYACDADGACVLIESTDAGPGAHRLRGLDPSGGERWSSTGVYTRVLLDRGGRLYLTPEDDGGEVAEFDFETGAVRRVIRRREGSGAPFASAGRLLSVFFDDASGRRGITVLDPATINSEEGLGEPARFAWLGHPFGADDHSRLYVWTEGRVARISMRGEIEELFAIDGIAVRAGDRRVFTSHAARGGVLVHVDGRGRHYRYGGEAPGRRGELRIYSASGQFESASTAWTSSELLALECRLPPHEAWQVDAAGRIIIPVVTPDGVAIVAR